MDRERWDRIQSLFHQVADLPPAEQRAFLDQASNGDETLAGDVLALLSEDARGSSLLDGGAATVAQQVLQGPAPPIAEIGPYRIRELLGEGGMGVVYLAEREDLGSLVAIKILRDAWMSPARRERFAAEQRMLAQLNHPSIARLYDADTLEDGTPWFVMEYVDGVPLTDYCSQRGSSIAERLGLFRCVCEAVEYAHQHALIHRDLKPSNVLVKPDGSIRLLDFGIAKQLDSLDSSTDQTRTALRMMTPAYASPEQIRGERVGVHTDVYSLGVILYELLAGALPFDLSNRSMGEVERMIVERELAKPSASSLKRPASKTAWDDLDVLCLTALHKDVARRYRSVEALVRDVDHFLNNQPLESRADTVGYRVGKFVRRNQRPVIATAVISATVIAMVIFFTVRLASARNAALAQAARTQRIQQFMLNLFEGGDKAAGPAKDLRVLTLIDRGAEEARSLNTEPAVQAELYQTLGGIYQKLGSLDRADTLLRSSLDQRRSLAGAEGDVAGSLVSLGLLRADQAQLDEAEKLVREGLDQARRQRPPDPAAVGKATLALGQVLEARGTYDKAIPVLEEAVKIFTQPGRAATPELAASLLELANVHFYAGHYDISESLNQRVLPMHRQLHGERHPLVAEDLINLGAIQFERGDYAAAERFYRQAIDMKKAFYGPDHTETASALTMLGRTVGFENRYDEAAGYLREALAIQERVYGPVHPKVASALNDLGNAALQKDHFDEAEADFRRIAEIYKSVYHDKHYLVATALSNLGSVYMARKENARAEPVFREALARYTDTLGAEHSNTAIAHLKLGRVLLRQDRFKEAEAETRAGYEILRKQVGPTNNFLLAARKDLTLIYAGLKQPENVKRFQAELAAK